MRAGMTHITRRRFFAQAGKMALGFSAVSSPLVAGCAQPAPTPAAPTPVGPSSGGRAPFQIMALRDLAVPSSLRPLRVPDAKDRPLSGSYGQPHVMRRSLIAFAHDAPCSTTATLRHRGVHLTWASSRRTFTGGPFTTYRARTSTASCSSTARATIGTTSAARAITLGGRWTRRKKSVAPCRSA